MKATKVHDLLAVIAEDTAPAVLVAELANCLEDQAGMTACWEWGQTLRLWAAQLRGVVEGRLEGRGT